MIDAHLCLLLHAHLPFIRHLEHETFLEEDWLFEAIEETYIPILSMLERLYNDNVHCKLTMTLSPSLCEMLADNFLMERFLKRLIKKEELLLHERKRTFETEQESSTTMYIKRIALCRRILNEEWSGNLLNGFRFFQEKKCVEIITCCATHAFLPLMSTVEGKRAQIKTAVNHYKIHFGCSPRGIWLPECAYAPGVEMILKECGLKHFFLDTVAFATSQPAAHLGAYAPVFLENSVAAFARDAHSSKEVWSTYEGYPGDVNYREFYKDEGYDGDYDTVRNCLHADGVRRDTGIKYHRITGNCKLDEKEFYNPSIAKEVAYAHAKDFIKERISHAKEISASMKNRTPLIVAPFDAELFGHWWFEGPWFLENIFREIANTNAQLDLITPSEILEEYPVNQVIHPAASSWGENGCYEVWLNGGNDWMYPPMHKAEKRMVFLANQNNIKDGVELKILTQMGRELLLAQASDWAFILTMGTSTEFASNSFMMHIERFNRLDKMLEENSICEKTLSEYEHLDNAFPAISPSDWATPSYGTQITQ